MSGRAISKISITSVHVVASKDFEGVNHKKTDRSRDFCDSKIFQDEMSFAYPHNFAAA